MPICQLPRRALLKTWSGAIAGVAFGSAMAGTARSADRQRSAEPIVRSYYKAWEQRDWAPFDALLAADFTFSSANDDDHIDKAAFKRACWDGQIGYIQNFDLEAVIARQDDAFVKYLCHTKNGKSFRNVEYHRIRGDRIISIECYFGEKSSFASAVGSTPS